MAKSCLKVSFFAVNVTYALLALCIAGTSIWYTLKVKEITDMRNPVRHQLSMNWELPQILHYIFAPIGIFSLLVTFCGFCGTNNRGALIVYNIFATIVTLLVVAAAVGLIIEGIPRNKDFIKETLVDVFEETKARGEIREKYKQFEISLGCCGTDGSRSYIYEVPEQCYHGKQSRSVRLGCIAIASNYTERGFYVVSAACGAVGVLAFSSIILAFLLIRRLGSKNIDS